MLEVLARIRHRRTLRQLSPYLDGMLSVQESRRLEAHLGQCQVCRDELAELQATVQALAELPLAETPRSFALTAAPRRIEASRPARRLEFGLRLATAAAAFVLAIVALGDLLGVPGGGEEERAPALMKIEREALPTETGGLQGARAITPPSEPNQLGVADKAATEAPAPPSAAAGAGQEAATSSAVPSEGVPEETATSGPPAVAPVSPGEPVEGQTGAGTPEATQMPAAGGTLAATATPAATALPATGPASETPAATQTPEPTEGPFSAYGPAGTPEAPSFAATPKTAAATATPPPAGAALVPSQPEGQPPAEAERQPLAAEEGGPSRETVLRWLEIGLATGLALLFVSWVLARRRGWA